MAVRVKDLTDQIGEIGPRSFLYCTKCGSECSANGADYFMTRADYVFRCCNKNMILAKKEIKYMAV